MCRIALAFAFLACTSHGRRVQASIAENDKQFDSFATLLLASHPAAAFAHGLPATRFASRTGNPHTLNRQQRGLQNLRMEDEPSAKAVTIGAAALGGALGVQLTDGLVTPVVLALVFAYLATLSNGLGDATKSAGGVAAKAYKKTVEINEEYDVLPKVKGAADSVVTVADNLNKNYGVTDQAVKYLKIEQVTEKIEEVKGDIGAKIDDLKSKASD